MGGETRLGIEFVYSHQTSKDAGAARAPGRKTSAPRTPMTDQRKNDFKSIWTMNAQIYAARFDKLSTTRPQATVVEKIIRLQPFAQSWQVTDKVTKN